MPNGVLPSCTIGVRPGLRFDPSFESMYVGHSPADSFDLRPQWWPEGSQVLSDTHPTDARLKELT